jgi:hypothetical protein
MKRLVLVIVLAACKRDHPCEKFADLAEGCFKEMPGSTFEEIEMICRIDERDRATSDSHFTGARDCMSATTCGELTACFERKKCRFVLTGPDDRTPQFMCF